MKFSAHQMFALLFGIGIPAGWIFYLLTDALPEVYARPVETYAWIGAEIFCSCFLIFAGFSWNKKKLRRLRDLFYFAGLSVLFYHGIRSAGWFWEELWWSAVIQWFTISFLSLIFGILFLYQNQKKNQRSHDEKRQ